MVESDSTVVIEVHKRAFTLLQRHPTMENLINYKTLHSRPWQAVRDSQKYSWRAYISSLTYHISSLYV